MSVAADARAPEPVPRGWLLLLVLPVVGLVLLLGEPRLDLQWEHHPSHFWLVLATAIVSVALAYVTSVVAGRQRDARLVLISLAFFSAAGFLGLHALATPGVLLAGSNKGFVIATPVGLFIASIFAACSVTALGGPRARSCSAIGPLLFAVLSVAMVVWAVLSIAGLPPLDGAAAAGRGDRAADGPRGDQRRPLRLRRDPDAGVLPAPRRHRDPRDRRRRSCSSARRWSPSSSAGTGG